MVIGRRSVVQGLVLMIGGVGMGRSAVAGPVTIDKIGDQVQTLLRGQLPDFVSAGTPGIRALYQYAVEHGDDLQYVPCFCGCARFGHRSNRDCYVKSLNRDGSVTYTSHAAT
ncbi:MAG: PCYCGC motif-containing (lipo)protein [Candidatus Rokuibacteriota bacterium]